MHACSKSFTVNLSSLYWSLGDVAIYTPLNQNLTRIRRTQFPYRPIYSSEFYMYLWKVELNIFPHLVHYPQLCYFLRPFTWIIIFSSIYFKRPESGHIILSTFTWWTHEIWKDCTFPRFLMECDFNAPLQKLVSLPVSLKMYYGWLLKLKAPSFLMCD